MSYVIAHFLVALLPEAVIIRAMCKVLDMRSNRLYVVVRLSLYCIAFSFKYLPSMPMIMELVTSITTNVIIPFVMSRGRVLSRLTRITLVNVGGIVTEFVGASTYHFISGGEFFPSEINQETILAVVMVYSLLALVAGIMLELVITLCARIDRERDTMLEPPVIFLSLFMFIGLDVLLVRLNQAGRYGLMGPFLCLLCCLCTLGAGMGLLVVAHRDAEAARIMADRAAMARQERHVRSVVEASVQRVTEMSRLRHDLANQVEVVERLVERGRYTDADHYLELLQLQAQALVGEEHE